MARVMEPGEGWSAFWKQAARNLNVGWSWSGFERSTFFVRDGARFIDCASVLGLDQVSDGRALVAGDLDEDGDLDLVGTTSGTHPAVYVLRNDYPAPGRALFVDAVPAERRSAAGTRLLLRSRRGTQRRDVVLGSGFLSQHATTQHFGLGDADGPLELEVRWPDGVEQSFAVPADARRVEVRQGDPSVHARAVGPPNQNATRRLPDIEWDSAPRPARRVDTRVSLAGLALEDLAGRAVTLETEGDDARPTLVNLWSIDCANCRRELGALKDAHAGGVFRVVGLALDPPERAAELERLVRDVELPYAVAQLADASQEVLRRRLDNLFSQDGGLALPTSLLLDAEGRVTVLCRGDVDIDGLARFVAAGGLR